MTVGWAEHETRIGAKINAYSSLVLTFINLASYI